MRYCDITIAYNESSGGIRTYIDEKRRHLLQHTTHEHLLIVPGQHDEVQRSGRSTTVYLHGPLLPGQDTYRYFARPDRVRDVLLDHRPDVIELGSYYLSPWAAFSYRQRLHEEGLTCLIGGYFHTDVAEAYVGAPLRNVVHTWLDDWSGPLAVLGERFAEIAAAGVEKYIGSVFDHCDLALAPSPAQAARLRDYGVERVQIVPLGVDLKLFHPRQRSTELRARFGAGPDDLVLMYAGRLSTEKRVLTLLEAFERLPGDLRAVLWIAGHGPLSGEIEAAAARSGSVHLLPFLAERVEFARLLASADLYVTAGPHETFALSVIEAQASGLPVVGVAAGALVERVPEGLGLLGPPDHPDAMAANIVQAAAERHQMGARARQHVEQNFGWDSTFRRLLDGYAAAIERLDRRLPSSQP